MGVAKKTYGAYGAAGRKSLKINGTPQNVNFTL